MNEFELIRRFFTHGAPGAALGVGDDAALVRIKAGTELAVSADMLVEGRHFLPRTDPALLGHKSLAVNLSDLAAMGAKPRWATLAIALPRVDTSWLAGFSAGFMKLARAHRVDLVGGDTTRGPLTISVQIMGEVPRGRALLRSGAKVGDDVWVSGELGAAALGLAALQRRVRVSRREMPALLERLHQPTPRVALGLALSGVANSAIDISDGLLADLGHICERSHVAATLLWESLPASPFVRAQAQQSELAVQAMLAGGDDYELCFTASPRKRAAVVAAAQRARTPVMLVGRITRAAARTPLVQVLDSIGKPMRTRFGGYDHFA